ncbi:hypothetical protein [Bradyrhizobium sp. 186]|uniref:hypothetical protein n=1 Tax=Bradyrhizobium sp. 186 TaxID=2782654 RepID=UPI0020011BE2|nr:hypothetical protein [Bradyrhizobium sp. 186]
MRKTTDIRRVAADVEAMQNCCGTAKPLSRCSFLRPAASWPDAKARHVLNLYTADLTSTDTHDRDLVTAILPDPTRLAGES